MYKNKGLATQWSNGKDHKRRAIPQEMSDSINDLKHDLRWAVRLVQMLEKRLLKLEADRISFLKADKK